MEHASAMMATTIVGDAAKLLLWAATWGVAKASKRIKSYRDGKKFLEEHGHASEAREALAGAKGDIDKARATLAKKRAQEQRARDQADLTQKPPPAAPRPDEPPAPQKDTPPPTPKAETPEAWMARVEEGLTPEEKVKLTKMTKGKTPEEQRAMLGGKDVETAREKIRKAVGEEREAVALRTRSQARTAELKQKIAELDLMNDPEVRAILRSAKPSRVKLVDLRDKVMARVLKAEAEAAHPNAEVLDGVKIYEKQAEATIEEWRANHRNPDGSLPSNPGLRKFGDGLYLERGEMDLVILERPATGAKAKILKREEVKTGTGDTHAKADAQLKAQSELLGVGARGQTKVRLVRGSNDGLADEIDLASDAGAIKATRGPANRVFNESLGITASDLEQLVEELLKTSPST
ncbi:MAG: hypothetical protein IPL61_27485 [Myxococcales bacterium]|nr:hypothetical protein [Myxococcales bacterium]